MTNHSSLWDAGANPLERAQNNAQLEISQWRELAETLMKSQSWRECVGACKSLLQLDPKHHFAQETLATALLQLGEQSQALEAVERLLKLSPRDPLHRLRYATLLQMEGRYGESLRQFERVVAMYPDAPFTPDARDAIETLDRLQTSQILLMASENFDFRWKLERDHRETLHDAGFALSENGLDILRQMVPPVEDDLEDTPPMH